MQNKVSEVEALSLLVLGYRLDENSRKKIHEIKTQPASNALA